MKKLLYGLLVLALAIPAIAEEYKDEAEIDLGSIKYNKSNNTSEIRMKMYNENYEPYRNEIYYAIYYLKFDCSKKLYKPLLIEGYNQKEQLMIVDYDPREMKPVAPGSNLEQAYIFACRIKPEPNVTE